jgi:hypothetical protein
VPWSPAQNFTYYVDNGRPEYVPTCPLNSGGSCTPSGLFVNLPSVSSTPYNNCYSITSPECTTEACWHTTRLAVMEKHSVLSLGDSDEMVRAAMNGGLTGLQKLNQNVPYLSGRILLAIAQTGTLSNDQKRALLLAHIPIQTAYLDLIQGYLPDQLWTELQETSVASETASSRSQLENVYLDLVAQEHQSIMHILAEKMAIEDWSGAENLLLSDDSQLSKQRLFGLFMHKNDYDRARFYLNQVQDNLWVELQSILLQRAEHYEAFTLSETQKTSLMQLANSGDEHSALAKAILMQLTEAVFLPQQPNAGEEIVERNAKPSKLVQTDISIYPNPVTSHLNVNLTPVFLESLQEMQVVSLVTGSATSLQPVESSFVIDLTAYPVGMYILRSSTQNGKQVQLPFAIIR